MYMNTLQTWCHVTISSKSHQERNRKTGGDVGRIECKLSEVNTRAASRGQNELIGEFKIVAGDVINIGRVGNEIHIHFNRN